jgi:hypothetical protein
MTSRPLPDQSTALSPSTARVWFQELSLSGAAVTNRFVQSPGVMGIAETRMLPSAQELLGTFNPKANGSDAAMLAELAARQTYLAVSTGGVETGEYVNRIVNGSGHRSVARAASITHLFTGITVPCVIELIRRGGEIARLTTSKTKAMDQPFYRVFGEVDEQLWQFSAIDRFKALRGSFGAELNDSSPDRRELFNLCDLQSKTIPLLHTMNLTQWHTLLKNSFASKGVNPEFRHLLALCADRLCERHPVLFLSRDSYVSGETETGDRSLQLDLQIAQPSFIERPEVVLAYPRDAVLGDSTAEDHEYIRFGFNVSGVSLETILEFAAHQDIKYERMPNAAYRIQGTNEQRQWQRAFIERFTELRAQVAGELSGITMSPSGRYAFETFDLGNRAYSFQFSRGLSEFHNLFIGRLAPSGNELEVQEVCRTMCERLHALFPETIQSVDYYRNIGNEQKF